MIMTEGKIVSEIYMLYELSMATGNTLDFEENCHSFLTTLMAKKELDSCWVINSDSNYTFHVTYSIPQSFVKEEKSFSSLYQNRDYPTSLSYEDDEVLFTDLGLEKGALGIFSFSEAGFLVIHSSKRTHFNNRELNQLVPLVNNFLISIEACQVYNSSVSQKEELDRLYNELSVTNDLLLKEILIRKKSEESLLLEKKRVEDSLKFKERFLANMSHEIRTPMNGILGMSKLLESAKLSSKNQGHLNSIRSSAKNLLVIINDILDLSKIEAGKLELESIGFHLKDLLKTTISSVEYLATEKDLYIELDYQSELDDMVLVGDPVRLGQIVTNLLSNAIKFTQQGKVILSCKSVQKYDEKLCFKFSVQDTGIGIPKDKVRTIFESFKQVDSSTTRKFGGTGLGLSITKQLVDLHHGNIWVESEEGEGTTFSFKITYQLGDKKDLPANAQEATNKAHLQGLKIMLVEDHKINQVYATSILDEHDVEVKLAENGKQAVDELKANPNYDVILMDMQMPIMGGEEATSVIRKELKLDVPIIALTANALKGDSEKYISKGMNEYISKPFEEEELIHKINKLTHNVVSTNQAAVEEEVSEAIETSQPMSNKLYDTSKLEMMSRGKDDFISKMLDLFIEENPKDLSTLLDAYEQKDYTALGKAAHKMKSSFGILNVEAVHTEIRELEEFSLSSINMDQIPTLVDKVKEVSVELVKQLQER